MRLAHIADIHIFPKNYDRLRHNWTEFIEQIKASNIDVIAIAGDIFEFKTTVRGTDIALFNEMMSGIPSNIKVIMIPGNHDYDEEHGTDLISHLVEPFANIHYSIKSRTIEIDGVVFHCISPFDGGKIHDTHVGGIAIYHDMVRGSELQNRSRVHNGEYGAEDFADIYDITLLGDIHLHQFLRTNVAYSGSFVQKTRGENLDHGWILWDVENCSGEFQRLTPYGNYVRISIVGGQYEIPEAVAPASVELEYFDTDPKRLKECQEELESKWQVPVQCVNRNTYAVEETIVRDDNSINRVIEDLSERLGLDADVMLAKHEQYSGALDFNRTRWELKSLRFNNIYAYGDGNTIDFSRINTIASLSGCNAIGKSSIANILRYILYNDQRTSALQNKFLLNNQNNNSGTIEVSIGIGDDTYVIKRTINRGQARNPVDMKKNGDPWKSGDINPAYDELAKLIGTREDFLDVNLASQDRGLTFIGKTDADKRKHIARMLGITNLEAIAQQVRADINGIKKATIEVERTRVENADELYERLAELVADSDGVNTTCDELAQHVKDVQQSTNNVARTVKAVDVVELPSAPEPRGNAELINYAETRGKLDIITEVVVETRRRLEFVEMVASQYELKLSTSEKPCEYSMDQLRGLAEEMRTIKLVDMAFVVDDYDVNAEPCDKPPVGDKEPVITQAHILPEGFDVHQAMIDMTTTRPIAELEQLELSTVAPIGDLETLRDQLANARARVNEYNYEMVAYDTSPEVSQYTQLQTRITELHQSARPDALAEYQSLNTKYKTIEAKYKTVEFNDCCSQCQCNKTIIKEASGSKALKTQRDALYRDAKNEKNRVAELTKVETLLVIVGGQLRQYWHTQVEQLNASIIAWQQHHSAHEAYTELEYARANITTRELIRKAHENEILADKTRYRAQMEQWTAYQRRINSEAHKYNQELRYRIVELLNMNHTHYATHLTNCDIQVEDLNDTLRRNEVFEQWQRYKRYKEIGLQNAEAEQQLETLRVELTEIQSAREEQLGRQRELTGELVLVREQIRSCETRADRLTELHEEQQILGQYRSLIVQAKSTIIENNIPRIEHMWNEQLSYMTNLRIRLEYADDKFFILLVEGKKETSSACASGFQRFVLDFTFRIISLDFAEVPLGKFLIIDEGTSSADPDNKDNIRAFLQQANIPFTFLLLISHDMEFNNIGTYNFHIVRQDGYSYIKSDSITPLRVGGSDDAPTLRQEQSREASRRRRSGRTTKEEEYRDRARSYALNTIEELFEGDICQVCNKAYVLRSRKRHLQSKNHLLKLGKEIESDDESDDSD